MLVCPLFRGLWLDDTRVSPWGFHCDKLKLKPEGRLEPKCPHPGPRAGTCLALTMRSWCRVQEEASPSAFLQNALSCGKLERLRLHFGTPVNISETGLPWPVQRFGETRHRPGLMSLPSCSHHPNVWGSGSCTGSTGSQAFWLC